MLKIIMIASGGAFGALLRYAVSGLVKGISNQFFPWGTLTVNLIGSFIIGFLAELFERIKIPKDIEALILVGLIGAFTTFSTYMLETIKLFRNGYIKSAILNILISTVLGLIVVLLGFGLTRFLFKFFRTAS